MSLGRAKHKRSQPSSSSSIWIWRSERRYTISSSRSPSGSVSSTASISTRSSVQYRSRFRSEGSLLSAESEDGRQLASAPENSRSERVLGETGEALDTRECERRHRNNGDHLPPQTLDEHKRQAEKVHRHALLQVRRVHVRQRSLAGVSYRIPGSLDSHDPLHRAELVNHALHVSLLCIVSLGL